jgi:HAD superfamily hydrolase (TIGR01490 family)
MKKSPVACFDVDGTIFRSSLLIELVEQFIKEDIFPLQAKDDYLVEYQAWQAREGSYDAYIQALIATFITHLRGVHYGDLADIGRRVVAVQSKHVYRYTRDLLINLKQQGYYTIAISQSPKTILDEFCAQYGFDKVYGRMYEIGPQDRFTGVCIDEHLIQNKANILKRILERQPELDKTQSIAVGDTEGDIPLLESVTRAICFNPNQQLLTHAKRMGWEVVVERKDVIYKM